MSATFDAKGFVNDFVISMNTKDPSRLIAHYTDNAVITDPSTPEPVRGKEAIRRNFEQWSTAFSQMKFEVKDIVESGNKVALHLDATGRHPGPIELGPGSRLAPTNKVVHMEVAEFLTITPEGKVSRDETIFDIAGMLAQLK